MFTRLLVVLRLYLFFTHYARVSIIFEQFLLNIMENFLFLGNKVKEPLHNVSILIKKNRALESAQIS